MSDRGGLFRSGAYPESALRRKSALERVLSRLWYLPLRVISGVPVPAIASRVAAANQGRVGTHAELQLLRYELRRSALGDKAVRQALALAATRARERLGITPTEAQIAAAWLLIRGRCVGFPDTAARPLTAAMAAAVAALSGIAVHVIVASGFQARRDAQAMGPLFESLGLTAGCVDESASGAERREAYAANIVYVVHREVAIDYLRDRLVLRGRPLTMGLRTEALTALTPSSPQLFLRGLQFGIVDDADTVLIDSAQVPVSISADGESAQETRWLSEALKLARQLAEGEDYRIRDDKFVEITDAGRQRLDGFARQMSGVWQGESRRHDIVRLALIADRVLGKDAEYAVAGETLQIGDEIVRLHAPEPSMVRLLKLLLELKEKCRLTAARETLARIGYPRFFRSYLRCGALTSDIGSLGPELWAVYGLRPARVGEHAPGLAVRLPDRIFHDRDRLLGEVVGRVKELHGRGFPVLLATRNQQGCSFWTQKLSQAGIENACLLGVQDEKEASAFAEVAAPGRVTVATHFAARGACATVSPETEKGGGLRIIHLQLLPSPRHERSVAERGIPPGTTGSVQRMLALDDELIAGYAPGWWRSPRWPLLRAAMLRYCQWRIGRDHAHARREQVQAEDFLGDLLAFSGRTD